MKKVLLSAALVITFGLYAFHQRTDKDQAIVSVVINQVTTESSSSQSTTVPVSQQTNSKYKDGSYTGNAKDAFYGNIQVQAVITGGKISDVIFLDYPKDRGTSVEINSQAMPALKQEAITAQSAQVDVVSGATQTSEAFKQSLASALSKAS